MGVTSCKKRADGIRVGDRVRVVTPEFFVRCGYPLTFAGEARRVGEERKDAIERFLAEAGVTNPHGVVRAADRVAKAVGYEVCRQQNFGGRERRIYTHRFEQYAGVEFVACGVRFVKTGVYEPGCTRGGYDGYEYEPAYLSNEKTHRIVYTTICDLLPGEPFAKVLEIEACHLEKVLS